MKHLQNQSIKERNHLTLSLLIYLASDTPLKERKSPHNRTMSVNEARSLGIKIPDILNTDDIDKDDPNMIFWTDSYTENAETGVLEDSGFADDISIIKMDEKTDDIRTEKKYCAILEWPNYTYERAQYLITYMKEHLRRASEIELWHIWMGQSYPPPQIHKKHIRVEELTASDIEKLMEYPVYEPKQMTGHVNIPRDWEIAADEMEQDVHDCYVIDGL